MIVDFPLLSLLLDCLLGCLVWCWCYCDLFADWLVYMFVGFGVDVGGWV